MCDLGKKDNTEIDEEESVQFVDMTISPYGTFEIYKAPSAEEAHRFLERRTVSQNYTYIIVETPEGKWGKDAEGLYLEKLLPMQLKISEAQCGGSIIGIPYIYGFGLAARGIADNFLADIKCGACGNCWLDGIRYRNKTVVRCPECKSLNLVDSSWFSFFARYPD